MGQTLVPEGLWEIVEPLIPPQRDRLQGGGTRHVDARAVFTAIVYVLTTGCAWRHLPTEFGVFQATPHRRFVTWTQAGLWRRLHRAVLDRLGEQAALDWSRAVVDAASVREIRGPLTGPNPVDRGKPGSKLHVLTDAVGLPLAVATSAINTHDSLALISLVQASPRSARAADRVDGVRAGCTRTRAMTTSICGPGCVGDASLRGSPAAAWRPPLSWADTARSSSARWPG